MVCVLLTKWWPKIVHNHHCDPKSLLHANQYNVAHRVQKKCNGYSISRVTLTCTRWPTSNHSCVQLVAKTGLTAGPIVPIQQSYRFSQSGWGKKASTQNRVRMNPTKPEEYVLTISSSLGFLFSTRSSVQCNGQW